MPKKSAGIVLYRKTKGMLEILLVHPGGPFWAKKDEHAWSIPKGELAEGEDAVKAAQRELREETGLVVEGKLIELTPAKQKSGKLVLAWAIEGNFDPVNLRSNMFEMEWPPRSGKMKEFPEVDKAAWFSIGEAAVKIVEGQVSIIHELQSKLSS
jgi:predicted NUDIX family NTP pyrophosphohydrolase